MSEVGRMVDWNPTVTSGSIIGGKECNSVFFHGSGALKILRPHVFQGKCLGAKDQPL